MQKQIYQNYQKSLNKKNLLKIYFFGLNKKIFFAWIEWTWKMIKYKYILIEYKHIWAILKKVRHCMSQTFKYHSIHEGLEQSFNFISGLVTPHKMFFGIWFTKHHLDSTFHLIAYSQNQPISMSERQTLLVLAFIEKNANDFSHNIASNSLYTPSCKMFLNSFK